MLHIREIDFRALDVPMLEPFGIATGAQELARNVLVRVVLDDGTRGFGEAAPFPAVSGETQAIALDALRDAQASLPGARADRYRAFSARAREVLERSPSALCAVETALIDALCRRAKLSAWSFFGGAEPALMTDITIPTGDVEHARRAAETRARAGFRCLKIKIGASDAAEDRARILAVLAAAPGAELILDANASLEAAAAVSLLESLGEARERVALFEQPTKRADLDGLRAVRERGRVKVAADESARSVADVRELARARAADVINVKLTKSGLVEAWDMCVCAQGLGLELMIGGMVETELAMTMSACLAAGLGGFRFVDLDTPLFMGPRPLSGGFEQRGPHLEVDRGFLGHGVEPVGALL